MILVHTCAKYVGVRRDHRNKSIKGDKEPTDTQRGCVGSGDSRRKLLELHYHQYDGRGGEDTAAHGTLYLERDLAGVFLPGMYSLASHLPDQSGL